jgi:polysaccharide export outer membrane protein
MKMMQGSFSIRGRAVGGALLAALCALLLVGCYPVRLTENFDNYPELGTLDSTDDTVTADEVEQRAERARALETLSNAPYPPYTIGAGDLLSIRVNDHPEMDTRIPVTPDGYIGMMFAGQVKLNGKSIPDACKHVEEKLKKYIKNPMVTITPLEIKSQVVTIAGGVHNPGVYPVYNGMRLTDLFAQAGGTSTRLIHGMTVDVADFRFSTFVRNGSILAIDFAAAIEQGDYLNNLKLHAGDYVYIAVRTETMVTLVGEVVSPRQHIWNSNMTVLELIASGGGLKETYWRYGIIIRGGDRGTRFYRVDLDGIMHGHKRNIRLEPGDLLYVPRDDISEYNVFVRKLMPTASLINSILGPWRYWVD